MTLNVVLLVAAAAGAAAAGWVLHRAGRPPTASTDDPVRTLELQVRLSALAAELRRIEADRDAFARAHHYLAVQGAYDALLREACRLSGFPVEDAPLRAGFRAGDEERFREEIGLAERGWSW